MANNDNPFLSLPAAQDNPVTAVAGQTNPFNALPPEGARENPFNALPEADPGILDEAGRAVVSGARRAGQSILNLTAPLAEGLQERFPLPSIRFGEGPAPEGPIELPEVLRPSTTLGRVGEGITQFVAGFGAVGLAGKAAGLTRAATPLGRFLQVEAQAIAGEQLTFDPHERRLSNLVQEFPALANPVTDFLQAETDDTESEARLKMALEGAAIGGTLSGFVESLRFLRGNRRAKRGTPEEPSPQIDSAVAREKESLLDLSTNIDAAKRAGKVPQPTPAPADEVLPPNLNTGRLDTSEAVSEELVTLSKVHDNFTPARRGVVAHEETRRLADTMGLSEQELLRRRKGVAFNAHEALASRQLLVDSGERLVQLASEAKGGSDQALFDFKQAMTRHVSIQEQVSGITAEAGRTLNQFNIIARTPGAQRAGLIKEIVENDKNLNAVIDQVADIGNAGGDLSRLVREASEPKLKDKLLETWINSLLSGPATHSVNVLSNTLTGLWTIPETLLASGISKLRGAKGADQVFARETLSRLYGFVQGGKDGIRMAWEAIKDPDSIPIGSGTKLEVQQGRPNAVGGKLGTFVNIPGRMLAAEDRLFQSIGYRQELNARAMNSGLAQGLKGRDLARHINETLASTPDDITAAAQGNARYQTFTQPVGDIAGNVTKAANAVPLNIGRAILPFIRTPTNIIKYAAERTPLGAFTKRYRDAVAKGGRDADLARSRLVMGSSIGAWVASMAADGTVTGRGPADPELRALWRETHQPYSLKIGDEWVAYQRVEPLGILLGVASDFVDVAGQIGADDPEADKIISSIGASVTQNLTSKTWLKGISDLVKVLSDPNRYGETWVQSYAGTLVPTILSQVTRSGLPGGVLQADPILRDTQDILEKLQSRVPGFSRDLPPRRNIFGEPIVSQGGLGPDLLSPLWTQRIENKPVAQEMLRLKAEVPRPKREIQGIKLTPQQFSELSRDTGQTAKRVVEQFIRSPQYGSLPDDIKRSTIEQIFRDVRKVTRDISVVKFGLASQIAEKRVDDLTR